MCPCWQDMQCGDDLPNSRVGPEKGVRSMRSVRSMPTEQNSRVEKVYGRE